MTRNAILKKLYMEKEQTHTQKKEPRKIVKLALFEAGIEFAFLIAAPLLGGVFLGQWLDGKYGTKYFVIIGILSAIAVSGFAIFKKIKEMDSRWSSSRTPIRDGNDKQK